ncbi:MAG: SDR family NAD(P)-dependent oxidoreductase, partial [Candidatus Binatia bacterium]
MDMRLEGKVAVVTGGAQGIGERYCLRFAKEGAAVGVLDLREEQARNVERQIVDGGGKAIAVTADVTDEQVMADACKKVADRFGRLDVLINNAAVYWDLDMTDRSVAYIKRLMDVNVYGVIIASRAAFPYMKQQRSGSIINISSVGAYPTMWPRGVD